MKAIRSYLLPLIAGTLFGSGLAIGGMTDPHRVKAFLDLFGRWDPTLAFVMGGALIVMAVAWQVRRRMDRPFFENRFSLPDRQDVDLRLIAGSVLFGVGWGLAGLCPGPAIADLALAPAQVLPFIAAMLAGMAAHRLVPTLA